MHAFEFWSRWLLAVAAILVAFELAQVALAQACTRSQFVGGRRARPRPAPREGA